MRKRVKLAAAVALFLPLALNAQEQNLERLIAPHLFSPQMIINSQARLDLTEGQEAAMRERTTEFHASIERFEWDLGEKTQALVLLVKEESVDAPRTLALFKEILDLEAQIKQRHLHLLIDLRNLLTPEQQGIMEEIMAERLRRLWG